MPEECTYREVSLTSYRRARMRLRLCVRVCVRLRVRVRARVHACLSFYSLLFYSRNVAPFWDEATPFWQRHPPK